jgi:hypothetical protein
VIEALRYQPEGRGIDSRLCHLNFLFFDRSLALGSTKPEMSTRNIFWGVKAAGAYG